MPINRTEIEKYFLVGDVVATGGGRSKFTINAINDNEVRIIISTGNEHIENYNRISAIVDNFDNIDRERATASVREILRETGQGEGNPAYVLGLAKEYLKRKNSNLPSLLEIQTEFELTVEKAKHFSFAERLEKLKNAPKKPAKRTTTLVTLKRNEYVVAEVLARANGICGKCKKPAPFIRKSDNTPYLEVHHVIRLADDGDDSVENAIALCPNCHRQAHFG